MVPKESGFNQSETASCYFNPGEPKTCFIFRKKLNCVYNGYYRLTKHKKVKKKN